MQNESKRFDALATQPMALSFCPSLKSKWVSVAIGLAVLLPLIVAITATSNPLWQARVWALLGACVLVGAALGVGVYRRIKEDQYPVMLTSKGIESHNFCGARKDYLWREIVNAWVVPMGNANALHLELAPGVASTAGAWHSRRSQPFVPLATFTATEQDLIVDGVMDHLRRTHGTSIQSHAQLSEHEPMAQLLAKASFPWLTYGLMAVQATLALLMLNEGADLISPSAQRLLQWGGNAASEVQRGQWWRMLTALFVHGGLVDLSLTMLGLWSLGRAAERIYGPTTCFMVYVGSGLLANAVALHFAAQSVVFVGGSASAVFGLAGALFIVAHQHRDVLPRLLGIPERVGTGAFMLYAVVQGFRARGLDNMAHLGALVTGATAAALLPQRFDLRHYAATLNQRRAMGLALALVFCGFFAILAPPARNDLQRQSTGPAVYDQAVKTFADASALIRQLEEQVQSGQISPAEMDALSRSALAPALGQAHALYAKAWLPPTDPRTALIGEYVQLTALMVELLSMESIVDPDTGTPKPVDALRAAFLNADIRAAKERLGELEEELRSKPLKS